MECDNFAGQTLRQVISNNLFKNKELWCIWHILAEGWGWCFCITY